MNMLDEIGSYLLANGVSPIYKAAIGDQPDSAVAIYEFGGAAPEFAHDGEAFQNCGLQVLVRDKSYSVARETINTIYGLLNGKTNLLMGGHRYLKITAVQSPFPFPRDENDRHRLVVNFEVVKN